LLYPGDQHSTDSIQSHHSNTRPTIVLFWIAISLRRILNLHAIEAPIVSGLLGQLNAAGSAFWTMDKIDKTQFSLPYAQIVKILTFFFLTLTPFTLAQACQWYTLPFMALATIGFCGLDEVAEILESPFGTDSNDIDLTQYGDALMADLEVMVLSRDYQLDSVFYEGDEVNFMEKLDEGVKTGESRRNLQQPKKQSSPWVPHLPCGAPQRNDKKDLEKFISLTQEALSQAKKASTETSLSEQYGQSKPSPFEESARYVAQPGQEVRLEVDSTGELRPTATGSGRDRSTDGGSPRGGATTPTSERDFAAGVQSCIGPLKVGYPKAGATAASTDVFESESQWNRQFLGPSGKQVQI